MADTLNNPTDPNDPTTTITRYTTTTVSSKHDSVFDKPSAGLVSVPAGARRAYTTIAFGNKGTIANFTMIEESRGSQASRMQVDATVDGKLHAIGTTTGLGTYSAIFYDGPICGSKRDSAMTKYLELSNLNARTATVYLYNDATSASSKSKCSAKFSGILNNMAVGIAEDNGVIYLKVALTLVGSWKK